MSFPLKITAVALGLLLAAAGRADTNVGDAFPALGGAGLVGTVPDTAGKIVLVDFWASWCAPCKASFPALGRLHDEFAPRGAVVIAVGVDEKSAAYSAFVRKYTPAFAVPHDAAQKLVSEVRVPAMPSTYLLDRNGRVRFLHRGFHGKDTEQEIRRELETLLAEKDQP